MSLSQSDFAIMKRSGIFNRVVLLALISFGDAFCAIILPNSLSRDRGKYFRKDSPNYLNECTSSMQVRFRISSFINWSANVIQGGSTNNSGEGNKKNDDMFNCVS